MKIPFTPDQFFEGFRQYNTSIWPLQWIALAVFALIAILSFRRTGLSSRCCLAVLAIGWAVNGAVFMLVFHARINPAAPIFGFFFLLQALLLAWVATTHEGRVVLEAKGLSLFGAIMVLYATVLYPLLGALAGHVYPSTPVLGVTPCPTTIFTLGMLLAARPAVPRWLFIIPIMWSALGSNAVAMGVYEDIGLGVSGALVLLLLVLQPLRARRHSLRAKGGSPA